MRDHADDAEVGSRGGESERAPVSDRARNRGCAFASGGRVELGRPECRMFRFLYLLLQSAGTRLAELERSKAPEVVNEKSSSEWHPARGTRIRLVQCY